MPLVAQEAARTWKGTWQCPDRFPFPKAMLQLRLMEIHRADLLERMHGRLPIVEAKTPLNTFRAIEGASI